MVNRTMGRLEGRLFAEAGRICMVVEVDETVGLGRVSYSIDGQQHLVDMPISEISMRVSAGTSLVLDNVSAPQESKRITKEMDGWFFRAREGLKGPFPTAEDAEQGLSQYILSAQSA